MKIKVSQIHVNYTLLIASLLALWVENNPLNLSAFISLLVFTLASSLVSVYKGKSEAILNDFQSEIKLLKESNNILQADVIETKKLAGITSHDL